MLCTSNIYPPAPNCKEARGLRCHALQSRSVPFLRQPGPIVSYAFAAYLACVAAVGQEMQVPADQRAFRAALSLPDPAQRLTAFRTFSVEYQDSKYFDSVQDAALRLLLQYFPTRTTEIRDQVQVNVANADKGYERWQEESTEADLLAGAGVLLPMAQKLGEDAHHNLTEATFLRGMAKMYGSLAAPMPAPEELHGPYLEAQSATLTALAHVYLKQGKLQACTALLDQAATALPLNAKVHALRGQVALAEHHEPEALDELERAQLLGEVSEPERNDLLKLYRAAHGGSDARLQADLDTLYAELYPPAFAPPARPHVQAGHVALLELFTGSSCGPCVGADLAVETLMKTYSRDEVVALELDEHVPRPDPLANPASVARAEIMGAGNTPNYFLDGKSMAVYGSSRDGAADVYASLAKLVDRQLTRSSGVQLQLSATWGADQALHVSAAVQTQAEDALKEVTAEENAPWPGDSIAVAERAHEDAAFPPRLVINFALVEDNVRYSGENGVRFHRMVMRAMSSDAAWGQPLHSGKTETFAATFIPDGVSRELATYLGRFEAANDRFGPVKFLSKDTTLHPEQLGVVAWVQDTRSHRVVQAAFVPIDQAPPAVQGGR